MKQTTAANLALALTLAGWSAAIPGGLSTLGDPRPEVSPEQLAAMWKVAIALETTGILALVAALWLSGYAFSGARRRSILTTALVVLPAALLSLGIL